MGKALPRKHRTSPILFWVSSLLLKPRQMPSQKLSCCPYSRMLESLLPMSPQLLLLLLLLQMTLQVLSKHFHRCGNSPVLPTGHSVICALKHAQPSVVDMHHEADKHGLHVCCLSQKPAMQVNKGLNAEHKCYINMQTVLAPQLDDAAADVASQNSNELPILHGPTAGYKNYLTCRSRLNPVR